MSNRLKLTDFFPLPAYDVDELAGLTAANLNNSKAGDLTSVPLAGFSEYGPAHNFAKDVEGFALDFNANSFQYDFGTFDDPNNNPAIVDVLVTTTHPRWACSRWFSLYQPSQPSPTEYF